jgi:hypothetical protein
MAFNQNQGNDCFTRGYLMKVRAEDKAKEAKALADLEKENAQTKK